MDQETNKEIEQVNPQQSRQNTLIAYIFILLCTAIFVYLNSLNGAFIYDDLSGIFENRFIAQPMHFLTNPAMLLNSLAFCIGKVNPFPYHIASVGVHALNVVLLFIFLRIFFADLPAFLAALLFAVHPANTESVAWISGRGYAVLGTFVLLTYILYNRATREAQGLDKRWYAGCLIVFAYFITWNYSFYFVMPLVIAWSDLVFGRWKKNWKYWIPFFVILLMRLSMVRPFIEQRLSAMVPAGAPAAFVWSNPLPRFFQSVAYHGGLLLWPQKLALYHEPLTSPGTVLMAGIIVFGGVLFFLPVLYRRARETLFAVGLIVLSLAPTYSPVIVTSLVAERYLYVPGIGLSIIAAFLFDRIFFSSDKLRKNTLVFFSFIILLCVFRTMSRNEEWKNPGIFWRKTLEAAPQNAWSHQHMGYTYQQENNMDAAANEYLQAIRLNPSLTDAYNNLGSIMMVSGRKDEAVSLYQKLLAIDPKFVKAYNNLGSLYSQMNRKDEAIASYHKALEIDPNYAVAYFNLGGIYYEMARYEEAAPLFNKAIQLDPNLKGLLERVLQQHPVQPPQQESPPQENKKRRRKKP